MIRVEKQQLHRGFLRHHHQYNRQRPQGAQGREILWHILLLAFARTHVHDSQLHEDLLLGIVDRLLHNFYTAEVTVEVIIYAFRGLNLSLDNAQQFVLLQPELCAPFSFSLTNGLSNILRVYGVSLAPIGIDSLGDVDVEGLLHGAGGGRQSDPAYITRVVSASLTPIGI